MRCGFSSAVAVLRHLAERDIDLLLRAVAVMVSFTVSPILCAPTFARRERTEFTSSPSIFRMMSPRSGLPCRPGR
jgi:hypothetical protein